MIETLLALGYKLVPVDGKRPMGMWAMGWPEHDFTAAEINTILKTYSEPGIGLKLENLIDFDGDTPEAAAVAESLNLPESVAWQSARGRHELFRLTPLQAEFFATSGKIVLNGLELRTGVNFQSVLPPSAGRTWLVSLEDSGPVVLPDSIFEDIKSRIPVREVVGYEPVESDDDRPLSQWDRKVAEDWSVFTAAVFDKLDYKHVGSNPGGGELYRHPNATQKQSLVFGHDAVDGIPLIHAYSPNCNGLPQGESVTPKTALALMMFGSDFKAAARFVSGKVSHDGSEFLDDLDCSIYTTVQTIQEKPVVVEKPTRILTDTDLDDRPRLPETAYLNPIGKYAVDLFSNYNIEADPAAILLQSLEIFGCLLGRNVWMTTEDGKLYSNGFLFVVGNKATGRKGTAWNHAKRLFKRESLPNDITTEEFDKMIYGRVDSGEGLIMSMLDTQKNGAEFSEDAPIKFLMQDSEAIALLNKSKIENATLQQNMMKCWDGTGLATSKSKVRAFVRKPHLSFVGHAQPIPLKDAFTNNMDYSGFMSRFKFMLTERCRIYFDPPPMPDECVDSHHGPLESALRWSVGVGELKLSPAAYGLCRRFYESSPDIFREHRHAMKYGMMFAVLRQSTTVSEADMSAAFAIQKYLCDCFKFLFKDWGHIGERVDDEQRIIDFLRDNPDATLSDISHRVFSRHKKHGELKSILKALKSTERIKCVTVRKGKNSTIGYTVAV